jgi:hypothetical protein
VEYSSVFQAGRFSLAASGIVVGGVMLGAALASFARPVPVEPQPAPWEGMLHPAIQVGESYPYYSSMPEEVIPDRYAPDIAFTTLKWWPSDLRLPREASYVPPQQQAVPQYVPDASLDTYQEVQVPHYAAIEQSAQQAQDAAKDAATAEQAPAPVEAAPAGQRKVIQVADQLAQAG